MSKLQTFVWLLLPVLAASTLTAQTPTAGKPDATPNGLSLPEGARLRLGSGGLSVGDSVAGGALSADGKCVAAGTVSEKAKHKARAFVWEVATGKQLASVEVAQNVASATDLSPDGKWLLTWGKYRPVTIEDDDPAVLVQLWDIATGK